MLASLLVTTLVFVAGTALTRDQLLAQQVAADAERVAEAMSARVEALSTAAQLLGNDPSVVEAIQENSEAALLTLNARALVVRDRFGLDLIQIYDRQGQARANLLVASLYRESWLLDQIVPEQVAVWAADDRLLLLYAVPIANSGGTVLVGIDLETELIRLVSEYHLPSDLALIYGETRIASREELRLDPQSDSGLYLYRLPLELGSTPVEIVLARSIDDIRQVTTTGLLVTVGSTLITTLLLIALSAVVTRSITQPIHQLSLAAVAVAGGDLRQSVQMPERYRPFGVSQDDEIGQLIRAFNSMVADLHSLYTDLGARVEARTHELSTAAEIARAISSSLDLETVLQTSVRLIQERLRFDFVSIFLVEPGSGVAVFRAGTGPAGQMLKEQGFQIVIGSKSLVSLAADTHSPRFVQDVKDVAVYLAHSLLPETRAEAAIPLIVGKSLIGVLDIQSTQPNAFPRPLTSLLMALGDQIATGIHNAQAYARQRDEAAYLAEVDRLKSQFLANMSHELHTPLNTIIGFSRALIRGMDGSLTADQAQELTAIHNAGLQLLTLINNILDISQLNAGMLTLQRQAVDLGGVLRSALEESAHLAQGKALSFHANIAADLPAIWADEQRIYQVVMNLLENAIQFTNRGQITVQAQVVEGLNLHTERVEPLVEVSVSDTGIGIPVEKQVDIFREFTQVDDPNSRRVGGAGLGLPIAKKLVELHGGRMWVESAVGRGSKFTFVLPLNCPQEANAPMTDVYQSVRRTS